MTERSAPRVTVPHLVGMPFHVARDLAGEAGVSLANPDPDGPPISSFAWPGLYWVTWQDPAPGSTVYQWDSVAVGIVKDGEQPGAGVVVSPSPPPSGDAHAEARRIELPSDD
jgi:hypothetical protein